MKHCDQCGTKLNLDAKFCHNCGAGLDNSIVNKSIDANLKVDLTNKTTEKILNGVGASLSSGVTGLKKTTNIFLRILWRVTKWAIVLGIIVVIGILLFQLYEDNEIEKYDQERQTKIENAKENAAQELQSKIENAKTHNKKWTVYGELDPASKKNFARYASITSEDGLCELSVQKRINGNELTGLDCIGVPISEFDDIYIKFDTGAVSTKMNLKSYSDSDEVYIPSGDQASYSGYMSYENFKIGLVSNDVVAIKIPNADSFWARFSLKGSTEAINKLGQELQ